MSYANASRVFTLAVPASGEFVQPDPLPFPANVHITMAAIDPTATAESEGPKLATLKILHRPVATEFDETDYLGGGYMDSDEDEEDDEDEDEDDEEDDSEEETSAKDSKASRKKAAAKDIQKLLDEATAMDVDSAKKGKKNGKKAAEEEDSESESADDDEDDSSEDFVEESVICTLDPTKMYQQPLNIVIADGEEVLFKSNGAYTVYLSGNYTLPDTSEEGSDYDSDVDLSPDEDDYYLNGIGESDEESDELDDLEDPRISEVTSDDDDVSKPAAIEAKPQSKKEKKAAAKAAQDVAKKVEKAVAVEAPAAPASKKRAADEMDIDAKPTTNGTKAPSTPAAATSETPALSKKQLKKLKANSGEAAPAPSPGSEKKKVQFAAELEQGPTPNGTKSATAPSPTPAATVPPATKASPTPAAASTSASSSTRNVKGVEIYDKKVGEKSEAKNGNKVSMRYIGKLQNGKIFDSNTKGKPFTFKLGSGEVIKGWDIGIAGMKIGGERKLTIPANLAYGSQAQPGIPKNSTLIFEVKLIDIK